MNIAPENIHAERTSSVQTRRIRFLGGNIVQRLFSALNDDDTIAHDIQPIMTTLGPVAHLYLEKEITSDEKANIAAELAQTHRVPVVIARIAPGTFKAFTAMAQFQLPGDTVSLFGADHPFIDTLGDDLLRLCEHPDAGDFILLGWRNGVTAVSFAEENGSHGGLSPEETNGFALLPGASWLPARPYRYLRPEDLRAAALFCQGRS